MNSTTVLNAFRKLNTQSYRTYYPEAPYKTQLSYLFWKEKGLTIKELKEAPGNLHKYIIKMNVQGNYESSLRYMERLESFVLNNLNTYFKMLDSEPKTEALEINALHGVIGLDNDEISLLGDSFKTIGHDLFQQDNINGSTKMLEKAWALKKGHINTELVQIGHCLGLCYILNPDISFLQAHLFYSQLIFKAIDINLNNHDLAAMMSNYAACWVFAATTFSDNNRADGKFYQNLDNAKLFYKKAANLDPSSKKYSTSIEVIDALLQGAVYGNIKKYINYTKNEFGSINLLKTLREGVKDNETYVPTKTKTDPRYSSGKDTSLNSTLKSNEMEHHRPLNSFVLKKLAKIRSD